MTSVTRRINQLTHQRPATSHLHRLAKYPNIDVTMFGELFLEVCGGHTVEYV